MFSAKSKTSTGIHIVDSAVYIAELERRGQAVAATRLVQADLPGAFAPGQLARDEVRWELAEVFDRVGTDHDIHYDCAQVALDHQAYHLKLLPAVPGNAAAQREHLQWEAEQFLADAVEGHAVDCLVAQSTGLVVAARRPLIDLYRDLFAQAEVDDVDFDVVPFALYNLARRAGLLGDGETALLLDVAQFEACVVLVQNGAPVAASTRAWNVGRDEQLADLEGYLAELLEKTGAAPQHLWLSGTAAAESTWSYELPTRLGLVGELVDPFRGIDVEPLEQLDAAVLQNSPEYGVAVGLALRGVTDSGDALHLDLLREQSSDSSNGFVRVAVLAVLAVACVGALYWVDQRYPLYGAWKKLLAGEQIVALDGEEVGAVVAEESPVVGAEREVENRPPTTLPRVREEAPAVVADSGERSVAETAAREREAPAVESLSRPPETVPVEAPPQWSGACLDVLQLIKQLPQEVRFGSLIGNGRGEYTLEGSRPTEAAALTQLRDALKESSDDVNLSQWWAGRDAERTFRFSFKGRLRQVQTRRLHPVPPAEANRAAARLSAWAHESGLDSLEMEAPIRIELSERLARQRQKLWARGSYMEMLSFATVLEQAGATMAVSELIVIPHYLREERWKKATFYAVVEMLTQAP